MRRAWLMLLCVASQASAAGSPVLRVEQDTRYGRQWIEVEKQGKSWVCRGSEMRGVFHPTSPLEGWPESRILKLEFSRPCARPARIVLSGKRSISACSTEHSFEELWAQLGARCPLKF
ncbi:MAG: hypothetical protein HUU37_08195 [Bdellovibrionales bacterium]|nr:hypothetical protein [Bdellovibrionales bacterium]